MAALIVETGVYFIQNVASGTVLDLPDGSNVNNTKVQGWAKRELNDELVPAQLWIIVHVTDTEYIIQNANSRTYLDLTSANVADGTAIICSHPTGYSNQRWTIKRNSTNTSYVIRNNLSGTFVELHGGLKANGTAVNIYAGDGWSTTNTHQLWNIVRA